MKRFLKGTLKGIAKGVALIVAAFFSLIVIAGLMAPDENPAVPNVDAGVYLSIDDMQIRYRQLGQGRDVLLIHGLPGSLEDFDPLMQALASRYRVTAFDRPGQGYSSAVGAKYSVEHNAHIAREVIQQLALRDVIVVGHSYGGSTALQMAIEQTPGVGGYVSLAAGADPDGEVDPLYYFVTTPIVGKGFLVVSSWTGNLIAKAKIKAGLESAFHPNLEWCTDEFVALRQKLWSQPAVAASIASEIPAMFDDLRSMQAHYGEIVAPVILIQGDGDRSTTVEESEYLLKAIPTAKRVMLENTGHYSIIVRTAEVIKAIDELSAIKAEETMAVYAQ